MNEQPPVQWVDIHGSPVQASGGVTLSNEELAKVMHGQSLGYPACLIFGDHASFQAGELHAHTEYWENIVVDCPTIHQAQVLEWLGNDMSVFS